MNKNRFQYLLLNSENNAKFKTLSQKLVLTSSENSSQNKYDTK